jgi:hypothetical protein
MKNNLFKTSPKPPGKLYFCHFDFKRPLAWAYWNTFSDFNENGIQ